MTDGAPSGAAYVVTGEAESRRQVAGRPSAHIRPGIWGGERGHRGRRGKEPETETKRALPRDAGRLYKDLKADISTDNEYFWIRWKILRDLRPDLAREVLSMKDRRAFA